MCVWWYKTNDCMRTTLSGDWKCMCSITTSERSKITFSTAANNTQNLAKGAFLQSTLVHCCIRAATAVHPHQPLRFHSPAASPFVSSPPPAHR